MRAVLDVNVPLSALLSPHGAPAQILSRWLVGDFELIVSRRLPAELERALVDPKVRARIPADLGTEFVSMLRGAGQVAPDQTRLPRRSSDPGDDYLIALAESERAMLVSGDRHLLALAGRFPIRSPAAFLEELARS